MLNDAVWETAAASNVPVPELGDAQRKQAAAWPYPACPNYSHGHSAALHQDQSQPSADVQPASSSMYWSKLPMMQPLMCHRPSCSKLLQLVAPESLDLRAVNAPPDSIAWVQRVSRPATPDPLSSPGSAAAATPDHEAAQAPFPGHGVSAPSLPDGAAEDGSQPLSTLQDQEAMREALQPRRMPGTVTLLHARMHAYCPCKLETKLRDTNSSLGLWNLEARFVLGSPQGKASGTQRSAPVIHAQQVGCQGILADSTHELLLGFCPAEFSCLA